MRYCILFLLFLISCGIKTTSEYKIITNSSDEFLKKTSFLALSVKGIDNNTDIDYLLNDMMMNHPWLDSTLPQEKMKIKI